MTSGEAGQEASMWSFKVGNQKSCYICHCDLDLSLASSETSLYMFSGRMNLALGTAWLARTSDKMAKWIKENLGDIKVHLGSDKKKNRVLTTREVMIF